ncbi:hypothetical protein [Micromonospora echinofusca]|uniref:Helicase conserved C-terminal domain-containing protein n=1 Tax=Micromonospora echinofusca TaxID=47858 RepID=A0ABS3VUZ2_MICEH|nr:hypothetical protein [Micromonospora echinofusca]MBO4208343.1 hypothetical protein [Micromonospora echinofusca]
MRMVFRLAPEEAYAPARDRLIRRFDTWARRQRRPVDPFVVMALLDHRWSDGDGLLGRWQPGDFEVTLLDWFPRKVTLAAAETGTVLPTVHAFVDFLFDQDLADRHCADQAELHAALDKMTDEFDAVMTDERRYGPAKFWTMRMLGAGVDPDDPAATQRYVDEVNAGRVPVDPTLLAQVMANHLEGSPDQPPPLPFVAAPADDVARTWAEQSVAVGRLRGLVAWVGAGRTLTATGRLRLADARELVELLETGDVLDPVIGDRVWKTRSSDDLYGVSVHVAWARAARVVRVVKGRLLPVKSAAKVVADPLALARRALAACFDRDFGTTVCVGGWAESILRWQVDEAVSTLALTLFTSTGPVPVAALRDLVYATVLDVPAPDEEQERYWRMGADRDTDLLIDLLGELGVLTVDGQHVELTPLGATLIAGQLRSFGLRVPGIEEFVDETAEVVVSTAADTDPASAAALLDAWYAHDPERSRAELRALAERTDDAAHRRLAKAYARR